MKSGCGQYLLGKAESVLEIDSNSAELLALGDQVNLAIEPSQLLELTLWFYVYPLLSMMLLTVLATLAGLPDHYVALCAFTGLALGVLATRYRMRSDKIRKRIRPQLSKVKMTGTAACKIQE